MQEGGDGVQNQPLPPVSVAPLQDVGEHLVSSSVLHPLASSNALNTSKGFNNALDTSKTGLPQLSPMAEGVRTLRQIGRLAPFDDARHRARLELGNTSAYGGELTEDLMTTIDGDQSSMFTSKRMHSMALEQKDDVIEQLKAQVELLESERDNKWRR